MTDGAHSTGEMTAIIEGTGDPEGLSTAVHADYALASEEWCSSGGTKGTPHETGEQVLGSGHEMISEILVGLDELAPASEYCVELVATNAGGTTYGGLVRFATIAQASPPVVATDGVQVLSATTVRLSGNADPGGRSTTLHADYAPAGSTWCATEGKEGAPSETDPVPIGSLNAMISELTIDLEGLTPGTEYCAQLVAQNESGTAFGGAVAFATPAQGSSPLIVAGGMIDSPQAGIPTDAPSGSLPPTGVARPLTAAQPLTRAQQLKRALRACGHKPKKRRAACARKARSRYRIIGNAGSRANQGTR